MRRAIDPSVLLGAPLSPDSGSQEVPMTEGLPSYITTETRDYVLLIGINRPAKRNAFDWSMLQDLSAAFTAYERDPHLRCAVVFAHGEHFTAGLDLADVAPHVAAGDLRFDDGAIDPWAVTGPARTKPLVMAVQGRCLTLGIELMLAADAVVAASNARFSQIEVKRGILPFGGATMRFVQAAGWGNAMRYLLTGDEFDAAEAYRLGLVQEVVEPGGELARALAIAQTIAAQAPLAVQATLASARIGVRQGFDAAADRLMPTVMALMQTEDAVEGFMSFVERRPAEFKGR
jgi:enoyl-CoA hydratase